MTIANSLTALSPLDGRYSEKTESLKPLFSEFGLIRHRVLIEIRWLLHLKPEMGNQLENVFKAFSQKDAERVKEIEKTTNHDVKAVEYFIKEKISDSKLSEWVHWGCTSNDVNNLSYALMLKTAKEEVLIPMIEKIISHLVTKTREYAGIAMLSRTHGQKATPTTMGKEFANVVMRLRLQLDNLRNVKFYGKVNGAVGNFNAHHVVFPEKNWPEISKAFVETLGLIYQPYTTQIEPHDFVAEFIHNIMRINTIFIDFARDIWGYISLEYFHQKNLAQEVGSSTMPHKVNPIDFENAEGNFYLSNGLLSTLADKLPISRYQRDLVDSTLMRNLGAGFGYAMVAYQSLLKGLDKIEIHGAVMEKDLEQSWEILAEPIQMAMRAYGVPHAYEKLKALTRGKRIDQQQMIEFINQLPIPDDMKEKLKKLTPQSYIGYARKLAENI